MVLFAAEPRISADSIRAALTDDCPNRLVTDAIFPGSCAKASGLRLGSNFRPPLSWNEGPFCHLGVPSNPGSSPGAKVLFGIQHWNEGQRDNVYLA